MSMRKRIEESDKMKTEAEIRKKLEQIEKSYKENPLDEFFIGGVNALRWVLEK